jgi:hypothetical protein
MTVETDIFNALKDLVPTNDDGRRGVWPDIAPAGVKRPYITYQQIGGQAVSFVERAVCSKKNGRFQINCWADTRAAATDMALQIEAALVMATSMQATPIGAISAVYEEDTRFYGTRQDFSIWSDR